ncbi:hypothetical protein CKJ90_32120, partial [Klebsiella pneumoniae]
ALVAGGAPPRRPAEPALPLTAGPDVAEMAGRSAPVLEARRLLRWWREALLRGDLLSQLYH